MNDIKLVLSEAEFQELVGLIDAGVRAAGLRSVKGAAALLEKLEQAKQLQDSDIDEK